LQDCWEARRLKVRPRRTAATMLLFKTQDKGKAAEK
jgi:hypothetical protein